MVRLREIPRTATFAWSPGSQLPLIATGTRAGAVDADFSNETVLELWDLGLGQPAGGQELQPAAKIATDSGFHDIAWGRLHDDYPRGIIAGALENGSLDLWNADTLLEGSSEARMSTTSKHSGAIKTIQFNPFRSELLASAGAKGELFISDLNNISNPFRLGNTAARADDIDCLDWNKKVPHIMVTGSSGGFVTVWDVKSKKESLTLNNLGRKPVSAVAWDPDKPTKLITAIPLDTDPLILLWDLRNSNAPEKVLRGHDQGVLSVSWCQQDNDLLLSCGKDNRTICWNPQSGQAYGEFPVVTNWTFQTRFNPHNPGLFATASFDGKVAIQSLQSVKSDQSQDTVEQSQTLDGEDFFSKAQTRPQADTFSLPKPPRWMEPPVAVSFGFGGKVVNVTSVDGSRSSKIRISSFEVDSTVGTTTESFEKELESGNLDSVCESRVTSASTGEEKADWTVIRTLISENPRKSLVDYLGFSDEADETAGGLAKLGLDDEKKDSLSAPQTNGTSAKSHNRLSSFFDNADGDNFLSDLAASKGAKTNNPFQVYTGSESESDRRITRSLILGHFEKALDICLEEDRMSDAFMIAICGGQKCIDKAQAAYFSRQSGGPNYLRLLASVVGKNLWDVVYNADLANWKEVMATLCTFADPKDYPDLCEALGDRLEDQMKGADDKTMIRKDASFCYLAGSKLEKVVSIWVEELQERETDGKANGTGDSSFSIHAKALQNFIEKVTVFREVTKFQDSERAKTSDWKLEALYEKYIEYADVIAAHGQIKVAEKYLDLLPTEYPLATMARNRVKQATRTAAPAPAAPKAATTAAARSTGKPLPPIGYQTEQPTSRQPSTLPYAPPSSQQQPANPYAPPSAGSYNSNTGYPPPQQMRHPSVVPSPPQQFGMSQYGQAAAPPPRAYSQSPSVPPPSQAKDMSNWNDIPETFAKPTSRRGTPAAGQASINSPFPNQPPSMQSSQPGPPSTGPPRARPSPPVAPPPKGPAPPPRMTSPLAGAPQMERPSSSTANLYAPPQTSSPSNQSMALPMAPPIARGPSPYNAPPSGAPPPNRYAPAPSVQQQSAPGPNARSIPPPPSATSFPSAAPPINPYAPQNRQESVSSSPYTPASPAQQMHQPPPQAIQHPPQSGPPQGPPSQSSRPGTASSHRRAPSSAPKYPPGDRSHIPVAAQPILEILSADMARVKGRAPSSFKAQVNDTEKRLNILFDHLNNEDLLKPDTVASMAELAAAIQSRNYEVAQAIHLDILTNKTEECGQWMVGVKRLIGMSRATP